MKLFVWDFHGVLERGTELATGEISNLVLASHGYAERFSNEDIDSLYGLKWYELYAHLLPEEPAHRHIQLQAACFDLSRQRTDITAKYTQPNDYAYEVTRAIAGRHDQILISNTRPEAINMFVQAVGLTDAFPPHKIFGVNADTVDGIRAKSDVLAEYLEGRSYEAIVTIGDSLGDMALADVAGGTRYLYSHPHKPHRDALADYRINDLREILREL